MGDKRQITVTFTITVEGHFLPTQLLYQGKTISCYTKFSFPSEFDVFHTPNHWADLDICIRFTENILVPYITKLREEIGSADQPALLVMDEFRGQMSDPVQAWIPQDSGCSCISAGATDKLQPLDLEVNKATKDFLQDRFHHQYAELVMKQFWDQEDPNKVQVNMTTAVMKDLGAQWLMLCMTT